MAILGVSGHRPKYWEHAPEKYRALVAIVRSYLQKERPDKIITGMALGMDTAVAEVAAELGIPFMAAVPFKGQETLWPQEDQDRYNSLLTKAFSTVVVCPGGFSPEAYKKRNEFIVANCHSLLILYNGAKRSGTGHLVGLATARQMPMVNLWDLLDGTEGPNGKA